MKEGGQRFSGVDPGRNHALVPGEPDLADQISLGNAIKPGAKIAISPHPEIVLGIDAKGCQFRICRLPASRHKNRLYTPFAESFANAAGLVPFLPGAELSAAISLYQTGEPALIGGIQGIEDSFRVGAKHIACQHWNLMVPGFSFDSALLEYREIGPSPKERADTTTQ
jgi:hypothetical protein